MIDCTRCGKENQEHYKFCLSCGAELARAKDASKRLVVPTPPGGVPAVRRSSNPPANDPGKQATVEIPKVAPLPATARPGEQSSPQPVATSAASETSEEGGKKGGRWAARSRPPAAIESTPPAAAKGAAVARVQVVQPSAGDKKCPNCGSPVPTAFRFCGTCGYTMPEEQGASGQPVVLEPKAIKGTQAAPQSSARRGSIVLIQPDGLDGERLPLEEKVTTIGREASKLYARDPYLSPKHAEFEFRGTQLWLRDAGSLNGVYVRIKANQPVAIEDGSVFRIGQEIMRFDALTLPKRNAEGSEVLGSPNTGYVGRVSALVGRQGTGNSFLVSSRGIYIGRERGDILFPEDGYVSGLHCRLYPDRGSVWLMDVGSSNGTFLRIRDAMKIDSGALVLMGQHLMRVEY